MNAAHRTILLLFAISGVSGLIYQVVWVRVFGNIFGNTIHSASVVTAVFMLGLGVGSYVAGRWADERSDESATIRAYGLAEAAIGIWGIGLALCVPMLEGLSPYLSSYQPDAHGWFVLTPLTVALRCLVALVLLTPPTFLMGATLTLVIRYVVLHHVELAGHRIGALYGLNTLGAAAGAFSTDLLLIPTFGNLGAQGFAAILNLVAAGGALRLAVPRAAELPSATEEPGEDAPVLGVAIGLALAGAAGMGLEILWFRFGSGLLLQQRSVFSLMLSTILIGVALGSLLGGWLHRRFRRAALFYLAGQTSLLGLAVISFLSLDKHQVITGFYETRDIAVDGWFGALNAAWWPTLRPLVVLTALPALAMGLSYPLANAAVQRLATRIGRRAGVLYMANTSGAVAGSLFVGLWLLPAVGLQGSALGVFGLILSGMICFAFGLRRDLLAHAKLAAVMFAMAAGSVAFWATLSPERLLRQTFLQLADPRLRILSHQEGVYQSVLVVEGPSGDRMLLTNGYTMSATNPTAQRYMRSFAHLPLLQSPKPERALVICFGVGNTAHAASLHPLSQLDVVDLASEVLGHASYFEAANHRVLESSKVRVFVNDGRNHLTRVEPSFYDLITMEPPPISQSGVASLYSEDYYELAKSRLKPGGFATQWLPADQVESDLQLSVIAAFVRVFPNAVLLSGAGSELILMGQRDGPNQLDPDRVASALSERPGVAEDMARIGLASVADIVMTFASGPIHLAKITSEARSITDDFPILEYQYPTFSAFPLEPSMFALETLAEWCPKCLASGPLASELERRLPEWRAYHRSLIEGP